MSDTEPREFSRRRKLAALLDVARYEPTWTAGIVGLGVLVALLEGVGLSFILPIIELIRTAGDPASEAEGILFVFLSIYRALGIPFTLKFVIGGVAAVLTARYTMSFGVAWLRSALRTEYMRYLQKRAFAGALDARIAYFDEEGSDDILNAIITQTFYAGRVIHRVVLFLSQLFLVAIYFGVAMLISPVLTVLTALVLGAFTFLIRRVIEPGYDIGDRVAEANERRQQTAQAGMQGIRDIRLFGVADELYDDFVDAVDKYTRARITLRRNQAAINNFYDLVVAVSVFVLIYFALRLADLSLGALGVFLFAMFRLGPKVSGLNTKIYQIENDLPHLVRTIEFIDGLERSEEPNDPSAPVPAEIERVECDDVWFSYDEEDVLRGVSFEVAKGDTVGFVGQSGTGKSTLVSLLTRMYELDDGEIRANGVPIGEMDVAEWRDRIAVVQQDPFVFNDTLRYNLTIGNRDVSEAKFDRVCEIAQVDEFLDDLPEGYDTLLGDEGVRLSGGQRQRVALARALIEDADLLVLDEATSDLDSRLELKVQRAIEGMSREYAIITIAHRLSTVKNADRIYTIENGRITESGSHEDLVDNGGKYAELYAIQSKG